MNRRTAIKTWLLGAVGLSVSSVATAADKPSPSVVVIHKPGPAWKSGVGFREQPGVADHIAHFRALRDKGLLQEGGPFLDNSGGMMVSVPGANLDEIKAHAEADPAVKSGLLTAETKLWLIAMTK